MTEIQKLNTRNAPSTWVPWVWLVGAALWLAGITIHDVFAEGGHAALHAACFAAFAVSGVATHQHRVNKAFAEEIRLLKKKLEQN